MYPQNAGEYKFNNSPTSKTEGCILSENRLVEIILIAEITSLLNVCVYLVENIAKMWYHA